MSQTSMNSDGRASSTTDAGTEDDGGLVAESRRRTVLLFEGIVAKVSINSATGVARVVNRPPSWSKVKKINLVVGKTLERISVIRQTEKTIEGYIRKPTPIQQQMGCDTCKRMHRKLSRTCSANLGLKPFPIRESHIYDIKTRQDIGKWQIDAQYLGHSGVGRVTCIKV